MWSLQCLCTFFPSLRCVRLYIIGPFLSIDLSYYLKLFKHHCFKISRVQSHALIDKDLRETQNTSMKFLCALLVYLSLIWRPLYFFSKSFPFLFLFLCVSKLSIFWAGLSGSTVGQSHSSHNQSGTSEDDRNGLPKTLLGKLTIMWSSYVHNWSNSQLMNSYSFCRPFNCWLLS